MDENWKIFKEDWQDYLIATALDDKEKKIQVATLRTAMGSECKKRLAGLSLTADEMKEH
jgi:hypothetical protein